MIIVCLELFEGLVGMGFPVAERELALALPGLLGLPEGLLGISGLLSELEGEGFDLELLGLLGLLLY